MVDAAVIPIWKCDNCNRLSATETVLVRIQTTQFIRTMADEPQIVEGDAQYMKVCPVCIKSAEFVGQGSVMMSQFGSEIR